MQEVADADVPVVGAVAHVAGANHAADVLVGPDAAAEPFAEAIVDALAEMQNRPPRPP